MERRTARRPGRFGLPLTGRRRAFRPQKREKMQKSGGLYKTALSAGCILNLANGRSQPAARGYQARYCRKTKSNFAVFSCFSFQSVIHIKVSDLERIRTLESLPSGSAEGVRAKRRARPNLSGKRTERKADVLLFGGLIAISALFFLYPGKTRRGAESRSLHGRPPLPGQKR